MTPTDDSLTRQARAVLHCHGLDDAVLTPLTGGLINATFRVDAPGGRRCVLQRLHPVFAPEVNLNLEVVTQALAGQGLITPRLLRAPDARAWITVEDRHWRVLSFVDGHSTEVVTSPALAAEAGHLLARFHAALAGWTTPLPHARQPVHDPERHFAALEAALDAHRDHRHAAAVAALAAAIGAAFRALPPVALTPLRLVHGDPKISNLLFDAAGRGLCLVDLDTLARAPLAYELGDALRSWCNPGAEDAPVASFSAALFDAALEGYAREGRRFMTADERAAVVPATATIYLELAARFAADALHESYFGWTPARHATRGDHNLARATNQLAAARDLLAQQAVLEATVRRVLA